MPEPIASPKAQKASLLLFLGFCAASLAGLAILAFFDPSAGKPGSIDVCAFHRLTGLHCAGCGTTRAIHALLHGDIRQAFAYNPLTMALAPFAVYLLVCWGLFSFGRKPLPLPKLSIALVLIIAFIFVSFTVLRNLPWEPLPLLAPHEIILR